MSTVGHELLNEIERVAAKRERWRVFGADFNAAASFAPGILMMTQAIDAAKVAIADNDPIASLRALEALRGFGSDGD